LDRFALPPSPEQRMRLVYDYNVDRIYIHPHIRGPRNFHDGSVEFEITQGETLLDRLKPNRQRKRETG
jgi:hypothetical protein